MPIIPSPPDEFYHGFRISYAGHNGYYIVTEKRPFLAAKYLWKNGTLHDICGAANFFETVEEAKLLIDSTRQTFISSEEMTI